MPSFITAGVYGRSKGRTVAGWVGLSAALLVGAAGTSLGCPPEALCLPGSPQAELDEHSLEAITLLVQASDELAPPGETPEQAACRREGMIEKFRTAGLCFSSNSTPEQMARIVGLYDTLPPGLVMSNTDRYFVDGTAWAGNSGQGPSGRAVRTTLRYSFAPDGIAWGNTASLNVLNASINARFTVGASDNGRELIRQALASWRRVGGLTYNEVADNGAAFNTSTGASGTGDIRIGAIPQDGAGGVLAYNFFPTGGSDMTMDSQDFTSSNFWSTSSNYRFLRNVVSHEHGHGLGFIHSVPCTATKLMEPFISTAYDTVQIDEIRAVQRNYGDRFAGNSSVSTAKNFGDLTSPVLKSIIEKDLSTNGSAGSNNSNQDWFKFTLSTPQNVVITVVPTGGSYVEGQQSSGCNGTTATVNAAQAGDLAVELRDGTGATTIQSAGAGAAGVSEVVTMNALAAGTYSVRVVDNGPNANQILQTYDLTIRVAAAKAPPQPIAGINKRIGAGLACYFKGDIYSRVTEAGATLNSASFDWDLDGDGVFETLDTPQPTRVYPANGVYNATLRVTDSNGMSATDTITVTVTGAASAFNSISPTSGSLGATIPVTLVGTNLGGVTAASQVVLSGTGVTVTGTPSVTGGGTTVSGLSFVIAGNAPAGLRNVTINNADGAGQVVSLTGAFNVSISPPSNDDCTAPLSWGSVVGLRPFTNSNATTGAIQSFPSTGCPTTGPIFNDVWYTWVAPISGSLGITTDSTPIFNSRVAIYTGSTCPSGTARLRGCDDFGFQYNIAVTSGQTYLFQVGSVTENQTGTANVVLTLTPFQGACCDSSGFCTVENQSNCTGSSLYQGTGTSCDQMPCIEPDGTCCAADGSCTFGPHELCAGSFAPGGTCSPNTCAQPTGTCCAADGSCVISEQTDCTGAWTSGQSCEPSPCGPATGACCNGTACTVATAAACTGAFQGVGSACGDAANPTTCCAANFNGVAGVSVQDIFDFLTAYFGSQPSADFNQSGAISVQDIFDFLSAYFTGC